MKLLTQQDISLKHHVPLFVNRNTFKIMIFCSVMPLTFWRKLPPSMFNFQQLPSKGKGQGHPKRGHESPEGRQRHSSTLSLTLTLDGMSGQFHTLTALPPGMTLLLLYRRLGEPQGCLDGLIKFRTHWDLISRPSSP